MEDFPKTLFQPVLTDSLTVEKLLPLDVDPNETFDIETRPGKERATYYPTGKRTAEGFEYILDVEVPPEDLDLDGLVIDVDEDGVFWMKFTAWLIVIGAAGLFGALAFGIFRACGVV